MVITNTEIKNGINKMFQYSRKISIKSYVGSNSLDEYDDGKIYTESGTTVWTSGILVPIDAKEGSNEAVLMAQGELSTKDKKLILRGETSIPTDFVIGLGSPSTEFYKRVPIGDYVLESRGEPLYKRIYLRVNNTGSLFDYNG